MRPYNSNRAGQGYSKKVFVGGSWPKGQAELPCSLPPTKTLFSIVVGGTETRRGYNPWRVFSFHALFWGDGGKLTPRTDSYNVQIPTSTRVFVLYGPSPLCSPRNGRPRRVRRSTPPKESEGSDNFHPVSDPRRSAAIKIFHRRLPPKAQSLTSFRPQSESPKSKSLVDQLSGYKGGFV